MRLQRMKTKRLIGFKTDLKNFNNSELVEDEVTNNMTSKDWLQIYRCQ
tara:strand:+ start:24114 stop:24257 length:144 start_codon:yes stop_codon:yes gene_type:complete